MPSEFEINVCCSSRTRRPNMVFAMMIMMMRERMDGQISCRHGRGRIRVEQCRLQRRRRRARR